MRRAAVSASYEKTAANSFLRNKSVFLDSYDSVINCHKLIKIINQARDPMNFHRGEALVGVFEN